MFAHSEQVVFKVGDKVLVEGRIESQSGKAWLVTAGGFSACAYTADEIRPWTERPPEPVRELWRDIDDNGFPVRVMSDGSPQVDADGAWGKPNNEHQILILAQYARFTASKK